MCFCLNNIFLQTIFIFIFLKDLLPDFMFWNSKECAVLF